MTQETEEFLRHTNDIRKALLQIFPVEAANYIVTLVVQDNLRRKSEKYYNEQNNAEKGAENLSEQI